MGDVFSAMADLQTAANSTDSTNCPWYNPFCLTVPVDNPNGCYGGGPNIDVATCAAANNAAAAAMAISQPAAAQDYADASSGNVLGLMNPFTGTGPLTKTASGIPSWAWITGGIALGLVALGAVRR